jgi:hypothetical protein
MRRPEFVQPPVEEVRMIVFVLWNGDFWTVEAAEPLDATRVTCKMGLATRPEERGVKDHCIEFQKAKPERDASADVRVEHVDAVSV